MKRFITFLTIMSLIMAVPVFGQLRTQAPAVADSLSGLSYKSFNEALTGQSAFTIGNNSAVATLKYSQLLYSPNGNGGYVQKVYAATGYADGTGGFTIDTNAPAGAVLQYVQMRVDVLLVSTGATWGAALSGGSTSTVTTGQAFTQNTKVSTLFASPVLTDVTDVVVSPNTGDISAGVVTAYVGVLEPIALGNAKAITYSGRTLSEAAANNGSINNTSPITLTLTGATYAWSNGVDYIANGYATVENVPDGLTLVLTKTSDTVLSLTATGNADLHDDSDNVTDAEIVLGAKAFAANVAPADVIYSSIDNLTFSFTGAGLTYSAATFTEAATNDGSINNTTPITITLAGDTFTGANGDNFVTGSKLVVTNLPTGLTAVATRTSSTLLTVTLTGNATTHANAQDVANLTFTFANTAFTANAAADVTNYAKTNLAVNFADPPVLTYSGATFAEAVANDGTIDNTTPITITLVGDTFTGTNADDFVDDGKIVVTNLSAGLTAVATRTSDTVLTITLTGTATAHANENDVADLTFTFDDSAFTLVDADNITNYAKADLAINYGD